MSMTRQLERPILITGCARSGTSLTAGIINLCGAFGGKMYGPTRYNRKGYFENSYIRREIQKNYMKDIAADPRGQHPFPGKRMDIPLGFGYTVKEAIKADGYHHGRWFYKDATICLNWPVWHKAFPNAQWLIVRRPDEDIIDSCMRTPFMNSYHTREQWQQWVLHHKGCFLDMQKAGLDMREVWTNDVVEKGDLTEIEKIVKSFSLNWDEKKVRGFVDSRLWKGNRIQNPGDRIQEVKTF